MECTEGWGYITVVEHLLMMHKIVSLTHITEKTTKKWHLYSSHLRQKFGTFETVFFYFPYILPLSLLE
jgi:hypothetical protein